MHGKIPVIVIAKKHQKFTIDSPFTCIYNLSTSMVKFNINLVRKVILS